MSYSWVDPHFASLYARRDDQRFADRLLADALDREARLPELGKITWRTTGWLESKLHGTPNLRLT